MVLVESYSLLDILFFVIAFCSGIFIFFHFISKLVEYLFSDLEV